MSRAPSSFIEIFLSHSCIIHGVALYVSCRPTELNPVIRADVYVPGALAGHTHCQHAEDACCRGRKRHKASTGCSKSRYRIDHLILHEVVKL